MFAGKKVAVMQPYFLPYIGYWQLMNAVDVFVLYDDIQFTKKGWINRNRYLSSSGPEYFSIPLKKDSDYLDVVERKVSENFKKDKLKIIRKIQASYRKALFYNEGIELLEKSLSSTNDNLFLFLFDSIVCLKNALGIDTELAISSELGLSRDLKGKDRVLSICERLGASEYINPIGGMDLYDKDFFETHGMTLWFQEVLSEPYDQQNDLFAPYLSIIDMIMYCGVENTCSKLNEMKLL